MFNPNVKIYIGDLKFNADSHRFIEFENGFELDHIYSAFDDRISFIDIDYSNLNRSNILDLVTKFNHKTVLTTLYPDKIDKKLECEIIYKDDWFEKKDDRIYEIVKRIFHSKNRNEIWRELQESKVSLFMINKFLQSNPTPENLTALKLVDRFLPLISPAIWISLVSYLVTSGPRYIEYQFKKNF